MNDLLPLVGVLAAVAVGALVAMAGGDLGVRVGDWSLFAICVGVAFLLQWIVFIHAYLAETEHFFDLTGSLTYALLVIICLIFGNGAPSSILLGVLILIWAGRLGSFLFSRVRAVGHDARFTKMKKHWPTFLMTWTLQGLWVSFTGACAYAAMTSGAPAELTWPAFLGLALWVAGFAIEVVADRQKSAFRADPANAEAFITTGIWAWSRHPNYFGEILLWIGIALIAVPSLQGWQYVTLFSPIWVWLLLRYISGVRMLHTRAERRWGQDPEYVAYRDRTPMLIPRSPG